MNFYNDNDPKICAWLRELINQNLIPNGVVDSRSIELIQPDELKPYTQCHFFCGVAGWSEALRLAGWPETKPVWTGSCPCQPLSCAGQRKGHADQRHLWPAFYNLIAKCKPATIFGEQVDGKDGREWLAGVRADLERTGYAVGVAGLCAASVGAPHIRQRLFWVADSEYNGSSPIIESGRTEKERRMPQPEGCCGVADSESKQHNRSGDERNGWKKSSDDCRLGDTDKQGLQGWNEKKLRECSGEQIVGERGSSGRMGESNGTRSQPGSKTTTTSGYRNSVIATGFWDDYEITLCLDGKSRRTQSGVCPLAHGVPARVVRLRGYGNAIVPEVAAKFIEAFLES